MTKWRERRNGDLHPGLAVMEERPIVIAEAGSKLSEGGSLYSLHGDWPFP